MDRLILLNFNQWAGKFRCLDILIIFLADYLIFFLPIIIFLIYFFFRRKKILSVLIQILLSLIFAYCLNYLIHYFVARSRPFLIEKEIYQLAKFFIQATDYSFPSYHTVAAFVLSLVILFDWKNFGIILLIPAAIVGLARIFAGVHYPSDILGGILIALISVFIVNYLISKFILIKFKID